MRIKLKKKHDKTKEKELKIKEIPLWISFQSFEFDIFRSDNTNVDLSLKF